MGAKWLHGSNPPLPGSVPFSRMNVDEVWEGVQGRRPLCLGEGRVWSAGRK